MLRRNYWRMRWFVADFIGELGSLMRMLGYGAFGSWLCRTAFAISMRTHAMVLVEYRIARVGKPDLPT